MKVYGFDLLPWPHLDAPRHLSLIPAELLAVKARELGLDQVYLTRGDGNANC